MGEMNKDAEQFLQEFGSLYGSRDIIPWDLYGKNDKQFLIDKIKLLLPDIPTDDNNARRENKKLENIRNSLAASLWNQTKYYGGGLLMSFVYVLYMESVEPVCSGKNKTKYAAYPLFRVRKCSVEDDSTDCCMIFIDDTSRVYQNWKDYKENNTLPEGVIVAPKNGIYNFDSDDNILLECFESPASGFLHKAGHVGNRAAGILGMGASAVTLTAIALAVAAPLLAVASVVSIGSSIWGAGSSIARLVDRRKHEEAINPTDAHARADWIGVASGVVGLGAAGSSSVLVEAAATGKSVSNVVQDTVNGLHIANIAINGVGVGNEVFDLILKNLNDEEISAMDVAQLGISLFLVTHSVFNFQTASKIVKASQDKSINNARSTLSNRQRKAFDKAYDETLRLQDTTDGKIDVIRALSSMPDSKQPRNDLYKVQDKLIENSWEASPESKIKIESEALGESVPQSTDDTDAEHVKQSAAETDAEHVQQSADETDAEHVKQSAAEHVQQSADETDAEHVKQSAAETDAEHVQHSADETDAEHFDQAPQPIYRVDNIEESIDRVTSIIANAPNASVSSATTLVECIRNLVQYITDEVLEILCRTARDFLEQFGREIVTKLKRYIPYEEVLWDIFEQAIEVCGDKLKVNEFITNTDHEFLVEMIKKFYLSLQPKLGKSVKCDLCRGFYTLQSA